MRILSIVVALSFALSTTAGCGKKKSEDSGEKKAAPSAAAQAAAAEA